MPSPRRNVSPERQGLYMLGNLMSVAGGLAFAMGFLVFLINFGNFNNFDFSAKTSGFCWFGGMALLIIGQIVRNLAARGLAGSGMVLDPEKAREDMEPLNRMQGGMLQDTLSEVDVVNKMAERLGRVGETESGGKEVVKVRCRACQALNDEHARFCNQCGAPV